MLVATAAPTAAPLPSCTATAPASDLITEVSSALTTRSRPVSSDFEFLIDASVVLPIVEDDAEPLSDAPEPVAAATEAAYDLISELFFARTPAVDCASISTPSIFAFTVLPISLTPIAAPIAALPPESDTLPANEKLRDLSSAFTVSASAVTFLPATVELISAGTSFSIPFRVSEPEPAKRLVDRPRPTAMPIIEALDSASTFTVPPLPAEHSQFRTLAVKAVFIRL